LSWRALTYEQLQNTKYFTALSMSGITSQATATVSQEQKRCKVFAKRGIYCGTKLPQQNHANDSRRYCSHFPSRFMIHARHTIIHSPKVSPHPSPNLRVLLLDSSLSTSLLSLANIVLLLSLQLCVAVAGNACNGTLDGTSGTVGDA
jgi:hypothetical protein